MEQKRSDKIRFFAGKLRHAGFVNILFATILNSVITFAYGIFIIRILSKYDYGVFSYIQNITNFGVIFCTAGLNLGMLQFCPQNIDEQLKFKYCRYAALGGFAASMAVILILNLYCGIDNSGIKDLSLLILEYSLLPILYCLKEWGCACLRWKLRNREYSNVLNVHSVMNACCAVLGAYIAGIHGVIWGIYAAYIMAILLAVFYLKKDIPLILHAGGLDKDKKKEFVSYSAVMCVTNALIAVLFTVDIFVIGNMLKNADDIAMYKTASVVPFALNMIPNAVMTFLFPHVAKNKTNKQWLRKNIKIMILGNALLNTFIGVMLYLFAPLIITVLFGNAYEQSLPIFRLLVISYIISASIRTPSANLLGMLGRSKTALAVSVATLVVSVSNSMYWVRTMGIKGAAIGSVLTFLIVGLISLGVVLRYIYKRENNISECERR